MADPLAVDWKSLFRAPFMDAIAWENGDLDVINLDIKRGYCTLLLDEFMYLLAMRRAGGPSKAFHTHLNIWDVVKGTPTQLAELDVDDKGVPKLYSWGDTVYLLGSQIQSVNSSTLLTHQHAFQFEKHPGTQSGHNFVDFWTLNEKEAIGSVDYQDSIRGYTAVFVRLQRDLITNEVKQMGAEKSHQSTTVCLHAPSRRLFHIGSSALIATDCDTLTDLWQYQPSSILSRLPRSITANEDYVVLAGHGVLEVVTSQTGTEVVQSRAYEDITEVSWLDAKENKLRVCCGGTEDAVARIVQKRSKGSVSASNRFDISGKIMSQSITCSNDLLMVMTKRELLFYSWRTGHRTADSIPISPSPLTVYRCHLAPDCSCALLQGADKHFLLRPRRKDRK